MSKAAYDSIVKETEFFNTKLASGKWKHIMLMSPRDLDVYQQPVFPKININDSNVWDIAPEGYVTKDSSLLTYNGSLTLPSFDNLNKQKFFIDIYLSRSEQLQWNTSVSDSRILLSQSNGTLCSEGSNKQQRIWVSIDWRKINKNEMLTGTITFAAGNKKMVVNVKAHYIKNVSMLAYKGFIENNGFVSISASHFDRQTNRTSNQRMLIDGLGYTGTVLQALPISLKSRAVVSEDSIKRLNSYVEYDFYSFTSVRPVVNVFSLPTHPINRNYRVRYAIAIDNQPLKIVDFKTVGRSEEWKQNVLRNRAERKIELQYLNPGKHTLKIYTVDPGVILDEIRIDLGGLKKAYSTIAETKLHHH